jgi:carbamoyltransferase
MSVTYKTTDLGFKNLKAACHEADKTVRAQILEKKTNSDYYKLINSFKSITKCGALLNTSFNLHGYPVVQNLEDALYVINNSGLDGLISKNYIILKN